MLRGALEKLLAEDKPSLAEVYRAGRTMGLAPRDIARIYKGSRLAGVSSFFSKHRYVFLPVAILTFLFLWYVVWYYSGTPGSSTYPAGTRYGVISTKHFKRKYLS